jgi:hypothetical protein
MPLSGGKPAGRLIPRRLIFSKFVVGDLSPSLLNNITPLFVENNIQTFNLFLFSDAMFISISE